MTRPLRILIAEDEGLIAMLLGDLLEAAGHEVCASVASAAEAVAAAAAHKPGLIIADGSLRDESSGVEAINDILRSGFVPHIFVTGNPYHLGAAPDSIILQKPFTPAALTRAINRALLALTLM